jgi:hypothetical protein
MEKAAFRLQSSFLTQGRRLIGDFVPIPKH